MALANPDFEVTLPASFISRFGQNRIYTTYMAVYLVISLPKFPYIYGSGQPYL